MTMTDEVKACIERLTKCKVEASKEKYGVHYRLLDDDDYNHVLISLSDLKEIEATAKIYYSCVVVVVYAFATMGPSRLGIYISGVSKNG